MDLFNNLNADIMGLLGGFVWAARLQKVENELVIARARENQARLNIMINHIQTARAEYEFDLFDADSMYDFDAFDFNPFNRNLDRVGGLIEAVNDIELECQFEIDFENDPSQFDY